MKFFKRNEFVILVTIALGLIGVTGVRMLVSFTLEPGVEPTGLAALVGLEALPVKERQALHPIQKTWSFEGFTGTYDKASVRRGLQVYREVCSACHSLDAVAFRNLTEIGYSEDAAKAIAGNYQIPAIDMFGDDVLRPATLSDYFPAPFPNENAAKASMGGKVPPDLSLMAKARADGPNYVYSLLTGYSDPPDDFVPLSDTTTYNPYFEGWEIGMAPPLYEDGIEFADGTGASVEQMATDVANFLMWTAEPKLEDRHEMGLKVVSYTLLMTLFFFLSMKTIWRRVKK